MGRSDRHRASGGSPTGLPAQVVAAIGKVSGAISPSRIRLIGESRYFATFFRM
ncbi:hypothetical protein ACRYCC_40340 [Actinomadura scrupuli]|uniref:hypothetical protein n=1 Tax=Actinomadura scrupuli TaxID=559629 RepID=UPI003D967472